MTASSFHTSSSSPSQQRNDDKDCGVVTAKTDAATATSPGAAPDSLDGPTEPLPPNEIPIIASNSEDNDTIEIVVTLPNQSDNDKNNASATVFDIPGAVKGGRKLALIYTCAVCETRAIKQFTERAYRHGVVIATCPGCRRQHLIADHLGYFDSDKAAFDLESLVLQQGHSFQTVKTQDDMAQVSLQDIVGKAKMDELLRDAKKEK
jgi:DNL zinc finger